MGVINREKLKQRLDQIYQGQDSLSVMNCKLFDSKENSEMKKWVEKQSEGLEEGERRRLYNEVFGWGPLEVLRGKKEIFDIIVKGASLIYYENPHGFHTLEDSFLSVISFENFTEELFKQANIRVSQKYPFSNGCLHPFRVHATIPPISKEINITLRRHQRGGTRIKDLLSRSFLNPCQLAKIKELIEKSMNFLVVGPTGSGKTTLLSAILHELPPMERSIVIEDTDELVLANCVSTKLLTRESNMENLPEVSMDTLIRQSLRMRPDRLIIGEVRGPEAKDMLQALATGHRGSFGSIHGSSPQQALYRLEMLIQMGASQWNLEAIRRLIHMSLQYLIVLDEDRYRKRVEGIYKITSLERVGFLIQKEC